MSAIRSLLLVLLVTAALLCAGCMQPASPPSGPPASAAPPVNMTVPFGPVPVLSPGGVNIAYELELAPAGNESLVPEKIEVLDPATGSLLYSADGELLAALWHPAVVPAPTAEELRSGTGKNPVPRISLWFTVKPGTVPDRIRHRLTLNRTAAGLPLLTITGADIPVRKDLAPVVIGSPMKGSGWTAIETTSPMTHHFSAQITMDGVTRVPQRYAQDWIYTDPTTGQVVTGNASLAKNYLGYGKEIFSVANGTVVDVLDGLPDLETIYSAPPATIDTAAGNYVIVDLGNRKYACYAHMIPGSIRVKKGDRVAEGQVIGQMGNSGNSDLPHLHFQVVTDTPSFLGAEGYPHVYRSFDEIGEVNLSQAQERASAPGYSITRVWSEFHDVVTFFPAPVPRREMLPENYDIVRLP